MNTLEAKLALRNALQTADDFDMLDTLEAFDAGDIRECYGARSDWNYQTWYGERMPDEWVSARDVFGTNRR